MPWLLTKKAAIPIILQYLVMSALTSIDGQACDWLNSLYDINQILIFVIFFFLKICLLKYTEIFIYLKNCSQNNLLKYLWSYRNLKI